MHGPLDIAYLTLHEWLYSLNQNKLLMIALMHLQQQIKKSSMTFLFGG